LNLREMGFGVEEIEQVVGNGLMEAGLPVD
jgi:hypothetical protein